VTSSSQALVARTYHPPFSNFLITNLFSIKFLYFFIISSLFPYFNLFVSIFIQFYVNIKLHVSTLYTVDSNKRLWHGLTTPLFSNFLFTSLLFHLFFLIIPSPTKLRRDIVTLPSVLPSVRHILVNTLGSTSFNGFSPN
jgi:hypothetical protein